MPSIPHPTRRRALSVLAILAVAASLLGAVPASATEGVGLFDPSTGRWRLRQASGATTAFYFGNPGDVPFTGDWDCDGIDTPGLYRISDGFAYLRNTNTAGVADVSFFFGDPGDVPIAGDFDGDGCDTLGIYRSSTQEFHIINRLGTDGGGLGRAEYSFVFGDPGDQPFVGDFDGDGIDEVGLHRASTGFVYYRDTLTTGVADHAFFFGDPGDRFVAGDWGPTDGVDTPGIFRPRDAAFYLRYANTEGNADESFPMGSSTWLPISGEWGNLPAPPCTVFPDDNIWNARVDTLPVHSRSDDYIATIGASTTLHPDFGSGEWPPGSGSPIGIPFVTVDGGQPDVPITYTDYGDESDPGPFPIPADAPVEGGSAGTGDRHVLVLDDEDCVLYELFNAFPQADGSWKASSGARYDLRSNALRPDGWTSADAAGLPILPGLIRYDEVASGEITHAIRFTAAQTQRAYVWPARHFASSITDPRYPPMGQRFRLRASFDTSGFSPEVRVILEAFKRYGLILADNGSSWFVSGAPDDRWDNDVLRELKSVPGSAFEAVDVSSLMVDPDSARVGP